MPWTIKDVDKHKKGLSAKAKRTWVTVANSALERCLEKDGKQSECEGSAIRQANTAAGNVKESDMPYKAYTMSTNNVLISVNAIDVDGEAVPIGELVAAYRGQDDIGEAKTKTIDGKSRPAGDFLVVEDPDKPSTWHLPVKVNGKLDRKLAGAAWAALHGGYRGNKYEGPDKSAAIKKLKAIYKAQEWETPAAESESGFTEAVAGSLEDYAMSVKDAFRVAFKPTTVSPGGEVGYDFWPRDVFKDDSSLGSTVVVRAEDSFLYAVEYEETGDGFRFATRDNWRKVVLTYVPVETEATEVTEAQLSESASGHVISLAETQAVTGGPRSPLLMDVALIMPGWGNKKDNHYYSPELLRRDAKIFEGIKMYTADHKPDQKSVRTEVSVIKEITGFTDDGAPIASVAVHDPDFAEATRNRAKLGTLDSLECSILAAGRTRKGKVGDRKGKIVEAITSANSVDWVTKAGAGGHAIALTESNIGGVNMEKDQVKRLLSESDLPQDVQERLAGVEYETEEAVKEAILAEAKAEKGGKPKPVVYLAEAEIKQLLEAARLPQQAKGRLAEGQYLDTEALKTAIESERAYIKELTGSGKPFAQGDTAPVDGIMSEADYDAEYDNIMKRHSVYVPQKEA